MKRKHRIFVRSVVAVALVSAMVFHAEPLPENVYFGVVWR